MQLKNIFPPVTWLSHYSKSDLKGDLSAGLTVGVMLIPQGMAYAMIAGLPPIYGLYASTVPIILYSLFGTSRQLAVGPVAMVSLLTAAGVGAMAEMGTEGYIMLAMALALIVGVVQALAGVFKLGFLVNFLSHPVISGFTSAAALIIGLSQLKHLLGVDLARSHHIHEIIHSAVVRADEINLVTLGIGLGGIALILVLRRINKAIPGALVAVVAGILVVKLFNLQEVGVKIVGDIPSGLPGFAMPDFTMSQILELLPVALTIALVGLMESIAVAKAIQAKHKDYKVLANQELFALGIANIGAAFFQGYPVTGGFSRTAVNDQAGAKTNLASIFSALLIVLTLLFLTPLFFYLPKAILASVIMVAVFGLIDIKEPKYLWKANRFDLAVLLTTFAATLGLGIEMGIGIGVVLSLAIVVFRSSRPHFAVLGNVPGTKYYRNTERFDDLKERDDLLILRFDAQLYFANVNYFKDTLEEQIARKGEALKAVILDAESMNEIDSTGIHTLKEIYHELQADGRACYLSGCRGPVRDAMERGGLTAAMGSENLFMHVSDAIEWHDSRNRSDMNGNLEEYVLQTNAINPED